MATVEIATPRRLDRVLESAWRRRLLTITWEQLPFIVAVLLAGTALMLFLGTDLVPSYILLLLVLASAIFAFVRIRRHLLPHYQVAQIVDHRLGLQDTLSTAYYLLTCQHGVNESLAAYQISEAEALAPSIELEKAFPLPGSRTWLIVAVLAVLVAGLFVGRYLITRSLNLQHAMLALPMASIFEQHEQAKSDLAQRRSRTGPQQGLLRNVPEASSNEGKSEQPPTPPGKGDQAEGQSTSEAGSQNTKSARSGKPADNQAGNHGPEAGNAQEALNHDPQQQASQQTNSPNAGSPKQESNNSDSGSPSLMNKVKDALSSLMAKMRPNAGDPKSQGENSQSPTDNKANEQEATGKSQGQSQQQNAKNEQSSEQQSAEGQAQGQSSEQAKASQGRNTDESPQKGADAHSGIGRQDGDKSVKEAEQLKAMGKLAEIIGKRSESLTGEMMVETPSNKQQLKTAYSQKMGHHADLGGEINRDEVPLSDQQYVREYMERVRKQDHLRP